MNRRDPRIQRTIDDFTTNFETFSTNAQSAAFSFTQEYLNPCLVSLSHCIDSSCAPCVAFRRDRARARRQRHTSRAGSRPELVFDFYNDIWEDDLDEGPNERTGLLGGWGGEDLDRMLAGSGANDQPRGHRQKMNYGSRGGAVQPRNRAKSAAVKGEVDPTVLPGSSMFGFLERLPWRIGNRGVRYRPSAADLQEGLGRKDREEARTEGERLLDDEDTSLGIGPARKSRHQRQRSGTVKSTDTETSLSSRGDLFPSDEEDDAVPLDDEFAFALERRATGDDSGGRSSRSKLTRTFSGFTSASRSTTRSKRKARAEESDVVLSSPGSQLVTPSSNMEIRLNENKESDSEGLEEDDLPTIEQLEEEDAQVREEEEAEVVRKREEARKIAIERGLVHDGSHDDAPLDDEPEFTEDLGSPDLPHEQAHQQEDTVQSLDTRDPPSLKQSPRDDHGPSED